MTAAAAAVANRLEVGMESVRRWVLQNQIDTGGRAGVTSEENDQVK